MDFLVCGVLFFQLSGMHLKFRSDVVCVVTHSDLKFCTLIKLE